MSVTTSMSIKNFLNTAPALLVKPKSILLRGNHGIGKSQVVRQAAQKYAEAAGIENFKVIDRRLSQMSEGDMIGLPSTDGNVTRFNPPDWYKDACNNPCCLFLDELNRATHEVMQAAFQIVLDRELNGWPLHPQTRVFSAVNSSSAYTVNEIDPALLSRFWVIDLEPTVDDWLNWAKGPGNMHPTITDFIATHETHLDPPKNAEPGQKCPDRRSWASCNDVLVATELIENPQNELFYSLCLGFLGVETSIKFADFAKSVDNRITGEDIVENYTWSWKQDKKSKKKEAVQNDGRVKAKVGRLGQERQNTAIEKAADYISKKIENLDEVQGNNVRDFMNDLPHELRMSLWSKLANVGVEKYELLASLQKYCVKSLLDIFGVPPGEAGINVVPNIPSMFDNANKKQ